MKVNWRYWRLEDFDDPAASALHRAIAEVKQSWSVSDQKCIISSSSVVRKARETVGPGCICIR
jgi:hypothetical protein